MTPRTGGAEGQRVGGGRRDRLLAGSSKCGPFLLLLVCVAGGCVRGVWASLRAQRATRAAAPVAVIPDLPLSLIAEVIDASGERVYGAVDAPGWVAPVGGIAVISTALLPVLLAPGDEAFRRQQGDEAKVNNRFGNSRNRKR